jgi:hypothetical protein
MATHNKCDQAKRKLEELLGTLPSGGPLRGAESNKVLVLLREIWPFLEGSSDESTSADKVHRAEDLAWNPPLLSFVLERHGGTVHGSTRADLHHWEVDIINMKARIREIGYRQLYSQDKRLDTRKLAEEVLDRICTGEDNPWLTWKNEEKTRVSLNMEEIIPETNEQTTRGRRKRFHDDLDGLLAERGWAKVSTGSKVTLEKV